VPERFVAGKEDSQIQADILQDRKLRKVYMKRGTRRIPPKSAATPKRRPTREQSDMTKRSKEAVRTGSKSKGIVPVSPSSPHSKNYNR
jgi:hypothetical protein